jgi:6-phosphogluconolactonase
MVRRSDGIIAFPAMIEIVVDSRERLAVEFVKRFERDAANAIAVRGRFSLAISGGSVARTLLPALVAAAVDWPRVDVFWCDERAVPASDPESNYGAAVALLFSRIPGRPAVLHPMPADVPDLARAADEYELELRNALGTTPVLDLMLLGAGPDGHVCSLFPGHPALEERDRSVVAVHGAPKPPSDRLTLTLPVVTGSRNLYLAVFGNEKAEMVREIVEDNSSLLPAAQALRHHAGAVCLLDDAAASRLSRA